MSYQPPAMPGHSSQPPPAWPPQPPAPRRSRAVPILVTALIALLIIVAVLAFYLSRHSGKASSATPAPVAVTASSAGADFVKVESSCNVTLPEYQYDVEDAGRTLNLIVAGPKGMDTNTATCLFDHLGMPEAVRQHVSTTRALDGQQTDSWPGYSARWTYHPDDGLQLTIREP